MRSILQQNILRVSVTFGAATLHTKAYKEGVWLNQEESHFAPLSAFIKLSWPNPIMPGNEVSLWAAPDTLRQVSFLHAVMASEHLSY